MRLIYDVFLYLNNVLCDFWVCLSVFEWDDEDEPLARWVELPVIATGSFLIRYVSKCHLSSTYENILIIITSTEISIRHIALN